MRDELRDAQRVAPAMHEPDLREILRKLWRRKSILVCTVIVVMALTAIALDYLAPHYTAAIEESFSRKLLTYAAAFVGSVLLGFVLVLFVERLDRGFRSMAEAERAMGVPALGLLPRLGGLGQAAGEPFDHIIDKPGSAFGESVRSLFSGVLLSSVDTPPRTVLITSSLPDEGKTLLSISLARMMALQGKKDVVLIDADLRRPQIHGKLGLPGAPGLAEYLLGEAPLEQIMQRDKRTGAIVIAAGGSPSDPTDLLASDRMKTLLDRLAQTSDLVVVDSPSVLAASDSRVLSRLADKTVYVVRWAMTRRETAILGIRQILDGGSDVAGVVLSRARVRKRAGYGSRDSGSYGGYSKPYMP